MIRARRDMLGDGGDMILGKWTDMTGNRIEWRRGEER